MIKSLIATVVPFSIAMGLWALLIWGALEGWKYVGR
jgi:hypothetical protein